MEIEINPPEQFFAWWERSPFRGRTKERPKIASGQGALRVRDSNGRTLCRLTIQTFDEICATQVRSSAHLAGDGAVLREESKPKSSRPPRKTTNPKTIALDEPAIINALATGPATCREVQEAVGIGDYQMIYFHLRSLCMRGIVRRFETVERGWLYQMAEAGG